MIMLIAKNTLIEGKQKEFTELAGKLVLATRKEVGCIAYDLVADQADACVYYFVEKYRDMAALEEHRASAHFQNFLFVKYCRLQSARKGDSVWDTRYYIENVLCRRKPFCCGMIF